MSARKKAAAKPVKAKRQEKAKKTWRISICLKDIGPKTTAMLRQAGMDENLTLIAGDVTLTDQRGLGFDHPMAYMELNEQTDSLIKQVIKVTTVEVP